MDVDGMTMMNAKLDALIRRIDKLGLNAILASLPPSCGFCHGGHPSIECQQMEDFNHGEYELCG